MRLEFDGELRYICPHCGKEQEWIDAEWTASGFSKVAFAIEGERVRPEEEELDPGDCDYIETTGAFRCPGCGAPLADHQVKDGFFRWLKRLREEDPKWYAKIIAELL